MTTYSFLIKKNLAKLNDHDAANRGNKFHGAALKAKMTNMVADELTDTGFLSIIEPVTIGFTWFYSSRHDFDNIRFAAKYCLDGMVKAGLLVDDSQKWVKGFDYDRFVKVPKGEEGVTITVTEVP